jgi:two-component system, NarL family, invasion response regulator UvrY
VSRAEIRILLVDDHAVVRAGFRRLLEQQAEFRVVAEAADAERAYALYAEHAPDVVIMDLSMPGASGLEAIRRIVGREPNARVLAFSMHEDAALAERAMQLGARGYVTKSSAPELLHAAVSAVAADKLALSPDIAQSLASLQRGGEQQLLAALSAREFEIFRLLACGRTPAEIARLLNISVKTVANHHSLVRQKLHLDNDIELVLLAQRQGVV